MLIVETIAKVRRLYHVDNKGFKTIARTLQLSKNTVKKIIRGDITEASYQRQEQSYRVLAPYITSLTEKLEFDCKEPKRRHRTAKKLWLELKEQGYPGSYDAVHAFVLHFRKQHHLVPAAAFIPLEFAAGEAFQFDWSTEEIELAGVLTRIKVAHIRLCYSRYFLLIAYPNEQLEMVMDAHNQAFRFLGGYCRQGIYDNMKTAVDKVGVGKAREYNKRFKQMCSHHLFEPVACTPGAGWEKGQVENQVSTGRKNFFTPLVKVKDLGVLNARLQEECQAWARITAHPIYKTKTVAEVYQEERPTLGAYRGDFDGYKPELAVVSPYSCIQFARNHYSVDCEYVGKSVDVRVYAGHIIITYKNCIIGSHPRCFARYQRLYDPWHYVPLLERKPGGLRHGAPFKQLKLPPAMEKIRAALTHYSESEKRFIRILLLVKPHGLKAVEAACALALSQGLGNDMGVLRCLEPPVEKPPTYPPRLQLRYRLSEGFQAYAHCLKEACYAK